MHRIIIAAVATLGLLGGSAVAEDLRVGISGNLSSLDPMFHYSTTNDNVARQIFDQLVLKDASLALQPMLATSWRNVDPKTWEFDLRKGVKFHDGSEFTADDVVFSLKRPPNVPDSPSSYAGYVSAIDTIEVIDPYHLRMTTKEPYPLLPLDMSIIHIMSAKAAEDKTTDDLNKGDGLVGTGPYKFASWTDKDIVRLTANNDYWGAKPEWETVELRSIVNEGARIAALLAGDVDLIENVPINDIGRLKSEPAFNVVSGASNRFMYLVLDTVRSPTPFVTDKDGAPLSPNPLSDVRVRRAISAAIDRVAIVDRIMEGHAIVANQFLPPGMAGHVESLEDLPFDSAEAEKMLSEAGYPEGFKLTLHGSNDRYVKAQSVLQAVAQMLQRSGLDVEVEVMPHTVFRSRGKELEFSAQFGGWASDDVSSPLRALMATRDDATGLGAANRGPYSNPELDAVLKEALSTFDVSQRAALFDKATAIGVEGLGVIPLYYEVSTWAMKKGLTYRVNVNQETLAQNVSREP